MSIYGKECFGKFKMSFDNFHVQLIDVCHVNIYVVIGTVKTKTEEGRNIDEYLRNHLCVAIFIGQTFHPELALKIL